MSGPRLPVGDRDSSPWFAGLDRHEILFQECRACHGYRWPLRSHCGACGGAQADTVAASGRGTVASWTVSHRAPPGVVTPFVTVLVRAEEQPDIFLPGAFDGPADGAGLALGAPVVASFVATAGSGTDHTVVRWRLARPKESPCTP